MRALLPLVALALLLVPAVADPGKYQTAKSFKRKKPAKD